MTKWGQRKRQQAEVTEMLNFSRFGSCVTSAGRNIYTALDSYSQLMDIHSLHQNLSSFIEPLPSDILLVH